MPRLGHEHDDLRQTFVDIVWERNQDGGYKTVDGVVCGTEVHSETTWSVDLES